MHNRQLLHLFFIFISLPVFSQSKHNRTDTIRIDRQHKLQPYIGLHISGDAEMFYIGPSFQLGTDYRLKKKLFLSGYIHYFTRRVNNTYVDFHEDGRIKILTAAILLQANTGKKPDKSFFIAGGLAYQYWHDKYESDFNNIDNERYTLLPAIRLGHFFPVGKQKLSVEINATGPYSYHDDNWSVTELITQLSLGCRFIF